MGGEVFDTYLIPDFDRLKMPIDHLVRDDAAEPVEETRLVDVTNLQSHVAFPDEVLEALVDADFPPLAGLLLEDSETFPRQELLPCKSG